MFARSLLSRVKRGARAFRRTARPAYTFLRSPMTVGRRVFLLLFVIVSLLGVASVRGYIALQSSSRAELHWIDDVQYVLREAGHLNALALKQQTEYERAFRYSVLLWRDSDVSESQLSVTQELFDSISIEFYEKSESVLAYIDQALSKQGPEAAVEVLLEFESWIRRFVETHRSFDSQVTQVLSSLKSGRVMSAMGFEPTADIAPATWLRTLNLLTDRGVSVVKALQRSVDSRRYQALLEMLFLSAIGIALSIGFGVSMTRKIVIPIKQAAALSLKIAEGRRDVTFPVYKDPSDETGVLLSALKKMVQSFQRSETMLEYQRNYVSSILEASPVPFLLLTHNLEIRYANKAFVKLFMVKDSLVGSSIFDLNRGSWKDPLFRSLVRDILSDSDKELSSCELMIQSESEGAALRNTEVLIRKLKTSNADENVSLLLTLTDLSAERATQEALYQAKEDAQRASQAKSMFLANMSHEIRTPLNAIIGMGDLLKETSLNPQQRHYVDVFERASQSLSSLVDDILDISKIEKGQVELEKISFDLQELAESTAELMSIKAAQKGLELNVNIGPDVPNFVLGDPTRIRQILVNLLGNAVKFTEKGFVSLSLLRLDAGSELAAHARLRFSVEDSGIGVPDSASKKIFEFFSQASSSTTRLFGGTGLGLAIVKGLVELMKGQIVYEARPEGGSVFSFTLDMTVPPEGQKFLSSVAQQQLINHSRVLILDKSEASRGALLRTLSKLGLQCFESDSTDAAIKILDSQPFDLVFIDDQFSGSEASINDFVTRWRSLSNAAAKVKLVLMSSSFDKDSLSDGHAELGVSAYLTKPIRRSELKRLCNELLGVEQPVPERIFSASEIDSEQGRILLVEDSADNREITLAYLAAHNFKIDVATNGEEAFRKVITTNYSLVLMDLQMPVMDGLEATRQIRHWEKVNSRARTSIVALSAYAVKEKKNEAVAAGADEFLSKPLKKNSLLEVLDRYTKVRILRDVGAEILAESKSFAQMQQGYLSRRLDELAKFHEALKGSDMQTIQLLSHRIRGNAASYGFGELGKLAAKVETSARTVCAENLEALLREYGACLETICAHELVGSEVNVKSESIGRPAEA